MIETLIKNIETSFLIILIFINSSGLNFFFIPENKVIRVIDGDTIDVYFNQKINRVRLIGLNTPESVDPNRMVECFGFESSNKLKELLNGKNIILKSDESQENKDKFGRYLRYVFVEEVNINEKMIAEGFGFEYTYKKPYLFQKDFREAEKYAKKNSLGLWNKNNCEY